ncbi:hypothetical protein EYF80_057478 [Liparis tanakae]|uniref:Uncharacterized protein n=1 Tax=Liparis tanakae TaxID=230148 RepID=A0A4Z2EVV4_9TELE|nr:hypothetical protein EYF80_057478 [Liparis tanakae]
MRHMQLREITGTRFPEEAERPSPAVESTGDQPETCPTRDVSNQRRVQRDNMSNQRRVQPETCPTRDVSNQRHVHRDNMKTRMGSADLDQ